MGTANRTLQRLPSLQTGVVRIRLCGWFRDISEQTRDEEMHYLNAKSM